MVVVIGRGRGCCHALEGEGGDAERGKNWGEEVGEQEEEEEEGKGHCEGRCVWLMVHEDLVYIWVFLLASSVSLSWSCLFSRSRLPSLCPGIFELRAHATS
jgi:hypothetical protein